MNLIHVYLPLLVGTNQNTVVYVQSLCKTMIYTDV